MLRRRKRDGEEVGPLRRAFDETVALVEEAKSSLVAVVPAGRAPGAPLADSLVAFEEGLNAARESLGSWPAGSKDVHDRCAAAIDEALRRAEKLRVEAPQLDYESLVMTLGALLAPLETFEEADRIV